MSGLPEMPCQELVEVLTDYLEHALSERDRMRLEAHLEECDACTAYLDQFRRTIALVGRVEVEQLAPETQAGLLHAFRELQL
jgi:anti-sigma factor RsiW